MVVQTATCFAARCKKACLCLQVRWRRARVLRHTRQTRLLAARCGMWQPETTSFYTGSDIVAVSLGQYHCPPLPAPDLAPKHLEWDTRPRLPGELKKREKGPVPDLAW